MQGVPPSTLADIRPTSEREPRPWLRRGGLGLLTTVVVLGAFGVFGVHSRTAAGSGGGYTLTVTYPQVARAGLDVPWRARVHRDGGIDTDVTLAVSSAYWRLFETQGFYPDADMATNDGEFVYLQFSKPPPGQDFVLEYDAYIQPAAQLGKSATIKLMIDGREMARVSIHTWLVP
jgi:hypothetical protein